MGTALTSRRRLHTATPSMSGMSIVQHYGVESGGGGEPQGPFPVLRAVIW